MICEIQNNVKGITMKKQNIYLAAIIILCASSMFIGCSATGWMSKEIPDASGIDQGDKVTITTKSGETVTGEYVALQEISMDEYVHLYQQSISNSSLGQVLPRYGEYVIVSTSAAPDKYWEGQFVSFDANHLSVKFKGESRSEDLFISGLNSITNSHGKSLQRLQFRQLFQDGDIMLRTAIVLQNGTSKKEIPLNTIENITARPDIKTQIADDFQKNGYSLFSHLVN